MVAHRILISYSLNMKNSDFDARYFVTAIVENDNIRTFKFCKAVEKRTEVVMGNITTVYKFTIFVASESEKKMKIG